MQQSGELVQAMWKWLGHRQHYDEALAREASPETSMPLMAASYRRSRFWFSRQMLDGTNDERESRL
jgi:hypothetical protein